jgi:hypothetical protein
LGVAKCFSLGSRYMMSRKRGTARQIRYPGPRT